MATREISCAASSLVAVLLDRAPTPLVEAARTRMSVHYDTGVAELPVLCVATPDAVRLPNSVIAAALPGPGCLTAGGGALHSGNAAWLPRRWWNPPRPRALRPPGHLPAFDLPLLAEIEPPPPTYDGLSASDLLGYGPGLTPAGDDVLAGALVTASATDDDRLGHWQQTTRQALATSRTTSVSAAMLHHALEGYATFELADFLVALCNGEDIEAPLARLIAVGHTSGTALLAGVLHTLTTSQMQGAA